MSPDVRLATFVAGLAWRDVPPDLASNVREHVLDALGVMCAGLSAEDSPNIRAVAEAGGGAAEASLVGCGKALPAAAAAFVNGFHGRIHTFDDTYEAGPVHPGTVVLAAALAVAERRHSSGADLLAGVLAGHEVSVRVADALGPGHYASGYHCTGTCNALGAAAAAARVLGLDADGVAGALGHAGSAASGLRQFIDTGTMTDSALNGARAAQTGVTAALLSKQGLRGAGDILSGRFGVLRVMSKDADPARLIDRLGEDWSYSKTALKPFPTCRFTHGPIAALLDLRQKHGIDPANVEEVMIAAFDQSVVTSDRPDVKTRFDALMSHQYGAAVALAMGRVGMDSLEPETIGNPAIRHLLSRIRVRHDKALDEFYPKRWPHRIDVSLKDGTTMSADSSNPPGDATAPLGRSVIVAKFLDLAQPVLGRSQAEDLRTAVDTLAENPDVATLGPLLRGGA
ncbi:MAG: MmgE/PrpD family protein [Proteobacteria bacterium]|nr:MmgE/PrpD family protein [Pseudomonadota bacterium]